MQPLSFRIDQADAVLAPYAVKNTKNLGRKFPDSEDITRFPFQRDRDRVIHAQAFRRLKDKTQVFVSGHGDHYRTRITHTLEVAQISRDIARTLGLNEDLAEAIALAHDLGHTPFGHAGEEAMTKCLCPFGKSFEHNQQSLRIVTVLEERTSTYRGLNLSLEVIEGLMKHRTPHDNPSEAEGVQRSPSLEAQIVNIADEIAYTAHDIDDGLRSGQITTSTIESTILGSEAIRRAKERGTDVRGSIVDHLVMDIYQTTESSFKKAAIKTLEDVYEASEPLVCFSSETVASLSELRTFLWDHLYRSDEVLTQARHGQKVITDLFRAYLQNPPIKVSELQEKNGSTVEEAIKDYIAGMTDPFALQMHAALSIH